MGASWSILGAFWSILGASWEHLGSILERLGSVLERLGSILERLGSILERLGASWERLGASLSTESGSLGEHRVPHLDYVYGGRHGQSRFNTPSPRGRADCLRFANPTEATTNSANMAPIGAKLRQNAFRTICNFRFFDAEFFFRTFVSDFFFGFS